MLYIASTGKQHPGAIQHTLSPGHRRVYTMMARQTSPTCLSTTGAMVSEPQSPKTQAISPQVAPSSSGLPSPMPHTFFQDSFSSSTPQCLANYATTSLPSPNGPPIPVLNAAAANDGLSTKRQPSTPLTPIGSYQVPFLQTCFLQIYQ